MKLESWELQSLEMDIAAVRRDGIDKYKGNERLIRKLERLLAELKKEAKADD